MPKSQRNIKKTLPDKKRRQFLVGFTTLMAGIGAVFASIPFIASWLPSARARAAGAPVEVDLTGIEPGNLLTVEWRGKPVWIIHRTEKMISALDNDSITVKLRDPKSLVEQQPVYAKNQYRSIKPEYLVLIGICTHLGCAPTYRPYINELGPDWPGGFYCPCHGSTFDLAGRVFKGVPAPINLEVPPYYYANSHTIVIGEEANNG